MKTILSILFLSFILLPAYANTCSPDTPHCVSVLGMSGNKGKIVHIEVDLVGSQTRCVNDTINENPGILRAMNHSIAKGEYLENQAVKIKFTQCYDIDCYKSKSLGMHTFKIIKMNTNEYATSPHDFTVYVDKNYGETCDI